MRSSPLYVYLVAVGAGPRLFPEDAPRRTLTLVGHDAFDNGVVHLAYQPIT